MGSVPSGSHISRMCQQYSDYSRRNVCSIGFLGLEGGPLEHKYKVAQFHFHWGKTNETGSEHRINDKMYAAEVCSTDRQFETKYNAICKMDNYLIFNLKALYKICQ